MMMKIYDVYAVIAGVVLCFLVIAIILYFAENIYNVIGRNGSLTITKIAAILMAAIAIKFIRQSIQVIFHL